MAETIITRLPDVKTSGILISMAVSSRKNTLRPGRARVLIFIFLVSGVLLGVFDAPDYWNRLVNVLVKKTKIEYFSYLHLRSPVFQPYRLGLDVQGGTHLVYQADMSNISTRDQADSMAGVRDVIERRVNLFGVSEPLVQVERSGSDWRLIVELAGIRKINLAIRVIGETPFLEFKEELPRGEADKKIKEIMGEDTRGVSAELLCSPSNMEFLIAFIRQNGGQDPCFVSTGLTGKYLKNSQLDFDSTSYQPLINLELTDEGGKIFALLTKKNVDRRIAIYLDGAPLSMPVVREEISGGRAQISGSFTPESAKILAGRLNAGALPVPIKLIAQQSVEASLGKESLEKSLNAGFIGFLAVTIFMIFWYRLPGIMATFALLFYVVLALSIFKLIPITLSVAGIAGFILSIGMAVDANVLIFERMKEELKSGKTIDESIRDGFGRAWTSIRDSNVSSLITSFILYWLGTSIVQGFALTLSIGILVSMFSAISVTRTLLLAVLFSKVERVRAIFFSGITIFEK